MNYSSKAGDVQAVQFIPESPVQMGLLADFLPRLAAELTPDGVVLAVPTQDGKSLATSGDWIVKESSGAFSVCKAATFAATYTTAPGKGR